MVNTPETIVAISTPIGRGGIGIIRVSGERAFEIVQIISKTALNLDEFQQLTTRKIIHGFIKNEQEEIIDQVLLSFMPKNKSYTGEPVVEINCHGGRAVLNSVLKLVNNAGARIAEAGEFTRRAVENGRIDLVQAEAINDIINARSEKSLKIALKQVEGGLTKRYQGLRTLIISLLTEIEAQIDFEVEDDKLNKKNWSNILGNIKNTIELMLNSSKIRKYMDHGLWIALVGAPNAGKSSLFNAILSIERAIVSELPGTTRDHISEIIDIEGVEVRLTDTAGMRCTDDKIESISINRSKEQIDVSDLVLYIIDQSQVISDRQEKEIIEYIKDKGLLILNKCDLEMNKTVEKFIDKHNLDTVSISAIKNEGINNLLDTIAEWISTSIPDIEDPIVTTLRQVKLLERAKEHINKAYLIINNENQLDVVTYEIENALKDLAEIIGEVSNEQLYDNIFSKFCVGK